MSERIYHVEDVEIRFSELDADWRCLCSFPASDAIIGIDAERVASLALFGAAVILAMDGELDHGILPAAVPQWIQDGILKVVGSEPEHG